MKNNKTENNEIKTINTISKNPQKSKQQQVINKNTKKIKNQKTISKKHLFFISVSRKK